MAGKKIATYTADTLACGSLSVKTKDLIKMGVIECTRAVVLESERVQVKLKHGDQLVGYTLSVSITREPINDEEKAEVAAFTAGVDKRKTERDTKAEAERQRDIATAYRYGKDGVTSALASLKDVAPALKALNEITKAVSE